MQSGSKVRKRLLASTSFVFFGCKKSWTILFLLLPTETKRGGKGFNIIILFTHTQSRRKKRRERNYFFIFGYAVFVCLFVNIPYYCTREEKKNVEFWGLVCFFYFLFKKHSSQRNTDHKKPLMLLQKNARVSFCGFCIFFKRLLLIFLFLFAKKCFVIPRYVDDE